MHVQLNIIGNISRDTEIKEFATSKKAVSGVAYSTGYGEKRISHFLDIECWGSKADILHKYALKGTRVFLTGSLEQQEWTDKAGQKRSKHIMVVKDIVLLSMKDKAMQAEMPMGKAKESEPFADPTTGQTEFDFDGLPF